jgi:hypothetical protein
MKLPFSLGTKAIAIIAVIITLIVVVPSTSFITSRVEKKKYELTISTLKDQIKEWKSIVVEAIKLPKYTISNTWTIEKNKKGQMVFVPSNNMEINETLKSIDTKLKYFDADENISVNDTIKPRKTFWERIKFW